jgi:twinkle protein
MSTWKDFNITITENNLAECPNCKSHKKQTTYTLKINKETNSWFCEHCGFAGNLAVGKQLPPKNNKEKTPWKYNPNISINNLHENLSKTVLENFKKKRISENTIRNFRIGQDDIYFRTIEETSKSLVYPYFKDSNLVNYVYYGKTRSSEIGGLEICFNYDKIDLEHTYIVLNELEVMTMYECGIENTISLFGGHNFDINPEKNKKALDFLSTIEDKISQIKKITLVLPNNDISDQLRDELLRRIGKEKCWIVQPPEKNSTWNDILVNYDKEKFIALLETAKPLPIKGVFNIVDVEDRFDDLYYHGLRKGVSIGYKTLDDYYTVVPGQWTIVTGIPGHGKSNFLDGIMVNLAQNQGWKFGIFSPENQPIERHFASILEKYFKSPFDVCKPGRITEEQKEEGKDWLNEHFSIILPDEDDNWSIDGILELAKALVYRKGINGIVIDPWNELDHSRPQNQTETEYISSVLTKIRRFCRNYDVHIWLVAHPAKLYKDKDGRYPVPTPYDISGSAHYRNKADNAITVWRNVGHDDQDVADIHVQKIRFKEVGKVGLCSLRFDRNSGVFVDDIDQSKRRKALEENIIISTERLKRGFS